MSKFFIGIALLFGLLIPAVALPGQAGAVEIFKDTCNAQGAGGGGSTACKSIDEQKGAGNPVINIIKTAINILSFLVGVLAVIGLVVSGIRMMAAGGDSNAVASARSGVIYSLIGIAVVALAQLIVAYVLDKVG